MKWQTREYRCPFCDRRILKYANEKTVKYRCCHGSKYVVMKLTESPDEVLRGEKKAWERASSHDSRFKVHRNPHGFADAIVVGRWTVLQLPSAGTTRNETCVDVIVDRLNDRDEGV